MYSIRNTEQHSNSVDNTERDSSDTCENTEINISRHYQFIADYIHNILFQTML